MVQPARKLPFQLRDKVNKKIEELEKLDVIEKAEGYPTTWLSPLVVIPKNNGDIRICVDMRQVNTAIERERFPLPNVDETLEEMNGSKWFSKLDLAQGFHQIPIDEESRKLTTFVTNDSVWRYKTLMFGVSNAPELFQRTIQQTLQGIKGCKNISDDIIIYGKNKEEHNTALRNVLQRLREKNLTLNKDKCVFSQNKITFMGHTLTSEGLLPHQDKKKAVLETQAPSSSKECKSFLGLVSYCSKFIPNFATIAEPIRKLTRKREQFVWGKDQQTAFDQLKNILTSAQVMAYYDPTAETSLIVDGSPVGVAAILSQKQQDGNFRPVAYASRTLNDTERRYSQIERETLAVLYGIERFHVYLYGMSFTVYSDHKPLQNIFTPGHKPPARIERWLLRLQSYKFTVKFSPCVYY